MPEEQVDVLSELSKYIFTSKYARYLPKEQRRETWCEAVDRVLGMHLKKFSGSKLTPAQRARIRWAFEMVRAKKVLPSMRSLDDNTLIPTPDGWDYVGKLGVGDQVFDQEGNICNILAVQKFSDIELFDVQFSDGSSLRASGDHLWVTSTRDDQRMDRGGGRKTRVINTDQIKATLMQGGRANHVVWNPNPLNLPEKTLPLDPYILGLWLGDGFSSGGQFSCDIEDSKEIAKSYTDIGFDAHKQTNNPHLWGTYGLATVLRSMGLLFNKHIPKDYLRASFQQRLSLIQGLMDTDGGSYSAAGGRSQFSNTNPLIIEGMKELLSSCGIKFIVVERQPRTERHQLIWRLCFHTALPVHRLSRKLSHLRNVDSVRTSHRTIFAVEAAGRGNATCFLIDSPNHTYLAGESMIVTHNSLQFAGPAVDAHNARLFNCSVTHVDTIRAFAEVFYLLLCGCGVGIGVTKKHVDRIPDLVSVKDRTGTTLTYIIDDSIEGWADSVEALLLCYTKGNPFSGRKVVMDYSRIRPRGALLKTGGGRAPGYLPLKNAHRQIKTLLEDCIEGRGQKTLRPIDVYDILMHTSDAVLAGGIRRSATVVIFDKDDQQMIDAKTGDWFKENPQRARSNNSALFLRNDLSFAEFSSIIERTRHWGEPGFVFSNHEDTLYNPCQPGWAPILTPDGIRKMADINVGDFIWSETGWTNVTAKWSTGVKEVFRYRTSAGTFYGTDNHRLVSGGIKTAAKDCSNIDVLNGPRFTLMETLDPDDIMAGLAIGDGTRQVRGGTQCYLNIGKNDHDYFESEVANLISSCNTKDEKPRLWKIKTDIRHEELVPLPLRTVPERYFGGSPRKVAGFLRGLFSANGSVISGNRVTLKATSEKLVEQVQMMLSSLGIRSYVTINEPKTVSFSNGDYICKQSYDVNIGSDRLLFVQAIGFIQEYKNTRMRPNKRPSNYRKTSYDLVSVDSLGEEEVFDITVNNESHTYWTGAHNVSNCLEIGFIPVTKDGRSGVAFCNLTSINGALVTSEQDVLDAAEAAAIIGTLQATYTSFPYLSAAAEELTKEEALLGVSITAMMERPIILFDPVLQQKAAHKVVETNKQWATILKINQAARTTCIKPEGSGSLAVGTMASGIHAAEDLWMFRRVQANKYDPVYLHFKAANPHMCEESVWSANQTDDVITFPIKVPDGSVVKRDLTALDHLGMIKSTQENWVLTGTTEANRKPVSHNVSCTVLVKEDEWDQVARYIYMNREFFSAVSLLPDDGGKRYDQAPVESVSTPEEFEEFHRLRDTMVGMDYTTLVETEDGTSHVQELACGGGACEVV